MNTWAYLEKTLKSKGLSTELVSAFRQRFEALGDDLLEILTTENDVIRELNKGGYLVSNETANVFLEAAKNTHYRSIPLSITVEDDSNPPVSVHRMEAEVTILDLSGNPTGEKFKVPVGSDGKINFELPQTLGDHAKAKNVAINIIFPDGTSVPTQPEQEIIHLDQEFANYSISFDSSEYREKRAISLNKWSTHTGLSISQQLKTRLSNLNLKSLHAIASSLDFRKEVDELPASSTIKEEAENLLSHAYLSLVSQDVKRNKTLIDNGINSIHDFSYISNSYARKLLPDDGKLIEAKEKAEAFESVRRNRVIEGKVERANGREVDENEEQETQPCECNCTSAVSPLAYLADFLDFVLREVELNGERLTIEKLTEKFHQPFKELPACCSASEAPVRQIRLVCEVLRAKAGNDGNVAVDAYIKHVYESLLDALGVSRKTLRLLRNKYQSEQGQRKADVLGINIESLGQLLLADNLLTEKKLEELFGLLPTVFDVTKHLALDEKNKPLLLNLQLERQKQIWHDEDYSEDYPIVDPQLLTEAHFCQPHVDNPAYQLWNSRKALVDEARSEIDQNQIDDMLTGAWSGNNWLNFSQISTKLENQDEVQVNHTIQTLKDEWYLTKESFQELKDAIKLLRNSAGVDVEILKTTRARVIDILTESRVYRHYSSGLSSHQITWHQEEKNLNIVLSPVYFCIQEVESTPPQFVSTLSQERHHLWREQLESFQPAIIDPDNIPVIPKPVTPKEGGTELRELLKKRVDELITLEKQLSDLFDKVKIKDHWKNLLGKGIYDAATNDIVVKGLGISNKDDVKSNLKQYGITTAEWKFCLELDQLIVNNTADEEDWKEFSHIYIQVHKRRYLYPLWLQEERELDITLSPEYFSHPEESLYQADQIIQRSELLLKWRGDYKAVRQWLKKLKARYQQRDALYDNLRNVIDQAEQVALPKLRDTLVEVLFKDEGETKTTLEQKKIEASNQLLINVLDNGCKKTTRVAQAFETLQLLVWGVLNKQLEEQKFSIPDGNRVPFDSSWEWLQSYGKWRAAMFVFIYPENFLLPSLHHDQSLFFEVVRKILSGEVLLAENKDQVIPEQDDQKRYTTWLTSFLYKALHGASPNSYQGIRIIIYLSVFMRKFSSYETIKEYLSSKDGFDEIYKYYPDSIFIFHGIDFLDLVDEWKAKHPKSYVYRNSQEDYFFKEIFVSKDSNFFKEHIVNERGLISFVSTTVHTNRAAPSFWKNHQWELEDVYLLPLHGALTLQQQGLFEDALKMFRWIYNYQKMEFRYPRVKELLDKREGTVEHYNEWLIDPINPHRLAITRTGADKRFLLMSIIRCLLEYAEEEFTIDTTVSLAHARELYYTAQRVLKESDLAQNLGDCKTGLSIEVGEYETSVGDRLAELKAKEDIEKEKNKKRVLRDQLNNAESQLTNPAPSDIEILESMDSRTMINIAGASLNYCIPPNPLINSFNLRVEVGLAKLNNCMNVAGIRREVPVYNAPTDTKSGLPTISGSGAIALPQTIPLSGTPYRYQVLIEKSKQLNSIAQQMEASYLSFLEKYDQESYSLLRAKQDLEISYSNILLQELRVTEATSNKNLAEQQKLRTEFTLNHYVELLDEGTIRQEKLAYNLLLASSIAQGLGAIVAGVGGGIAAGAATGGTLAFAGGIIGAFGGAILGGGGAFSSASSYLSMRASFERRKEEWNYQKELIELYDLKISDIQIQLAKSRESIVFKEKEIAETNSINAQDVINYLSNKFTNAELYHWMSGVIREVYSYFLQQATVTARLAQAQLMFERQEQGINFILSNYWHMTTQRNASFSSDNDSPDRRGMTGSARLLQDIHKLDQHAFTTERRKLEMSKTISLALLDPIVFQKFRETGSLLFNTTHEMFDRDLPGHYMRLIKRVRVAVIALVPPIDGIKGTLSNVGLSRVMVSPDNAMFEERNITREPESIVLTAVNNNNGVFEMQDKPEMFLPFESTGVAALWEFNLPKPANALDFNSIADVLVTIDYTALDSPIYRDQVIKNMDPSVEAERPFSFRQQFADAWYDLHHPEQTANPMTVIFQTRREDFPANVIDLSISRVTLYFAHKKGDAIKDKELELELYFTEFDSNEKNGGEVSTSDLLASTQVAAAWNLIMGKKPLGDWWLSINDRDEFAELLRQGLIEDILFVVTYTGTMETWDS